MDTGTRNVHPCPLKFFQKFLLKTDPISLGEIGVTAFIRLGGSSQAFPGVLKT